MNDWGSKGVRLGLYPFNTDNCIKIEIYVIKSSGKHIYVISTPSNPTFI